MADVAVVEKARAGDEEAFTRLVEDYSASVYRTAYMILRDHGAAEDVVQEAFIICYRKIAGFQGRASFATWLYKIVINLCRDKMRKNKREVALLEKVVQNDTWSGDEAGTDLDLRLELKQVIDSLKPEHRILLTLYYGLDMSVKRVAEILNLPEGTVKSRLSTARALVKERLGEMPYAMS